MNKYSFPVIILGMHRSGTTMITVMLKQLGLFIGNDLEDNSESLFFLRHNDWLLEQSGSSWDNPEPISWFFRNEQLIQLAEDYIRDRISGFPVISYVGLKRFAKRQCPLLGMEQPWGWKDPRTTFTLPLWLRLFPDSRVIHIYRNGVDVASSLRTRERRHLREAEKIHKKRKRIGIYKFISKKAGFVWSNRCLSLDGGFSLWEEYISESIKIAGQVGHAFSLKYEDFIKDSTSGLSELVKYCGLSPTHDEIQKVASSAKPDRSNAYKNDEELLTYYSTTKSRDLMKRLGYD